MEEKTVPWWRKALNYALDGIRSGFGLFSRAAKPKAVVEPEAPADRKENLEQEEVSLTQDSPDVKANAAEAVEVAKSAPVPDAVAVETGSDVEKDAAADVKPGAEAVVEESESLPAVVPEAAAESEPETESTPEAVLDKGVEPQESAAEAEAADSISELPAEAPTAIEAEVEKVASITEEPEAEPVLDAEEVDVELAEPVVEPDAEPAVEPILEQADEQLEENAVESADVEEPETEIAAEVEPNVENPEVEPEAVESVVETAVEADSAVESGDMEADAAENVEGAAEEEPIPADPNEAHLDSVEAQAYSAYVSYGLTTAGFTGTGAAAADEMPVAPSAEPEAATEKAEIDAAVAEVSAAAPIAEAETAEAVEEPVALPIEPVEETPEQPAQDIAEPELQHSDAATPEVGAEIEAAPAVEVVAAAVAEAASGAGAIVQTAPQVVAESPEPALTAKPLIKVETRDNEADLSPFSVIVEQVYDGPLDLLLDLIRKQDIDIYDIPISKITAQFLAYVNQLKATDVDVAGEFIYTASLLIHIKSKMLLPRAPAGEDDAAEDPRRELVERLLEHERFKNAAQMLQQKQMLEAATWTNPGLREFRDDASVEPEIAADTVDLVRIFRDILERARSRPVINLEEDSVTVGQMIQFLARRLTMEDKPVALRRLLSHTRSEKALIAMFLALLELVRLQAILLRQDRAFSEIFIKKHTGFDAVMDQGLANARDDWR